MSSVFADPNPSGHPQMDLGTLTFWKTGAVDRRALISVVGWNSLASEYPFYPSASAVKNLLPMQELQETWVWSLGQEDSLEEGMITRSYVLA